MVASPRNHRQLTPRTFGFGEFLFALGILAKGQNMSEVAVKGGGDAFVPWTEFNAVNQRAEHVGGLGANGGII
jgi:hypothetical protein